MIIKKNKPMVYRGGHRNPKSNWLSIGWSLTQAAALIVIGILIYILAGLILFLRALLPVLILALAIFIAIWAAKSMGVF